MGKKSKRRGGGGSGGKRNAGVSNSRNHAGGGTLATADTDTLFSAEEAAALLRVPTPNGLKGIISTNDSPDKCALCFSDLLGLEYVSCCGKMCCLDCDEKPEDPLEAPFFILDLLGNSRCVFCNALFLKQDAILKQEAQLGRTWAQYSLGRSLEYRPTPDALHWFRRAANSGHPGAFFELSRMYLGGKLVHRDLQLSAAFAEKARSLHPGMGISCNSILLKIAKAHISDGEEDEAYDILLSMSRETDESALNGMLCDNVAARTFGKVSAEMFARAFCYGRIESAVCASMQFLCCDKVALSKLWLDVACKTKSLFKSIKDANVNKDGS